MSEALEGGQPVLPLRLAPRLILTEDDLHEAVEKLLAQDAFVLDVETTIEVHPILNEVLWVGLASYGQVVLIPIGHPHGVKLMPERVVEEDDMSTVRPYKTNPNKMTKPKKHKVTYPATFGPVVPQLRPDIVFRALKPLFFSDRIKIGHNVKFDAMSVGKYYDEPIPGPFADTMHMAHVLNENEIDYSLKRLVSQWILGAAGRNNDVRSKFYPNLGAKVEVEGLYDIAAYLAKDVFYTWRFYQRGRQRLEQEGLLSAFQLECDLLPAIIAMESTGVLMDTAVLDRVGAQLAVDIRQIEIDAWRICGEQYPLTQRAKKIEYLFGTPTDEHPTYQGLKPLTYTKKTNQPQLTDTVLEHYAERNQLAALFQKFAELDKLRGAFVESLLQHTINGRVHASIHQHRTKTGRFSASDPNVQQVPRPDDSKPEGTQMREVFITSPGYKLVVADYDQIELRIIAYLSQDPEMTRTFAEGRDIHFEAAVAMLGIAPEDMTKEDRQVGKMVNFSVGFGASSYRLAAATGRSIDEADDFIERYYLKYGRIQQWKSELLLKAIKKANTANPIFEPPYVEIAPYGRRRRLVDLLSTDKRDRARAQRQAVNAAVQGFAANIMKLALIDLHATLGVTHPSANLLLTVHDEVMVECLEEHAEEVQMVVKTCMERVSVNGSPILGEVPLIASGSIGNNWLEAK